MSDAVHGWHDAQFAAEVERLRGENARLMDDLHETQETLAVSESGILRELVVQNLIAEAKRQGAAEALNTLAGQWDDEPHTLELHASLEPYREMLEKHIGIAIGLCARTARFEAAKLREAGNG